MLKHTTLHVILCLSMIHILEFYYLNYSSEGNAISRLAVGLVYLSSKRPSEDGTPVPKHEGVGTCHELYLIKCICWSTYCLSFLI